MGLKANADGSGAIQVGGSDAITITSGLNTTFAGTATVAGTAVYPLVASTAKTAPPTVPQYFEFTGIPSWVRRVTVMFSGVSTNGSSVPLIQLGDSGGVQTTGYASAGGRPSAVLTSTSGILAAYDSNSAWALSGIVTIALINTNSWVANGTSYSENGPFVYYVAGRKTLSNTLDRIRITTTGSDTFDAGTINILYE